LSGTTSSRSVDEEHGAPDGVRGEQQAERRRDAGGDGSGLALVGPQGADEVGDPEAERAGRRRHAEQPEHGRAQARGGTGRVIASARAQPLGLQLQERGHPIRWQGRRELPREHRVASEDPEQIGQATTGRSRVIAVAVAIHRAGLEEVAGEGRASAHPELRHESS
jgi:hypothetical protein